MIIVKTNIIFFHKQIQHINPNFTNIKLSDLRGVMDCINFKMNTFKFKRLIISGKKIII